VLADPTGGQGSGRAVVVVALACCYKKMSVFLDDATGRSARSSTNKDLRVVVVFLDYRL